MQNRLWIGLAAFPGALGGACDSEEVPARRGGGREELWLLQTRVFSDEGTMGYVIPAGELGNAHE